MRQAERERERQTDRQRNIGLWCSNILS